MMPSGWSEAIVRERIFDLYREAERARLPRPKHREGDAPRSGWRRWRVPAALFRSLLSKTRHHAPRVSEGLDQASQA
jgi:hypothetical protein